MTATIGMFYLSALASTFARGDLGGRCPVVTDARVPRRDPVNMMSPPDHDRHDRHVLPLSVRIDLRSRGSWGAGDLYRWASRWTFAWVAPVIVVTLVCPAAVLRLD